MPETLQQILTLHVATSDEIKLLCDMLWMNNFAFYKERESFLRWAIKNYVYILHAIFLMDTIWRVVQYSEKLHATELQLSTNLPPVHWKQTQFASIISVILW